MNVYAMPGASLQQIGGDCPDGWVVMNEERPDVMLVATAVGEWIESPPTVPGSVSALQGMLALSAAGHLEAVEAMFGEADTQLVYRLAWQRAQTWDRDSPTVSYMADRMGWDSAYVDQLFIAGEKLKG